MPDATKFRRPRDSACFGYGDKFEWPFTENINNCIKKHVLVKGTIDRIGNVSSETVVDIITGLSSVRLRVQEI